MAKRNKASKSRSADKEVSKAQEEMADWGVPYLVKDLIEVERSRMMRAYSVLECAIMAMESEEPPYRKGPYYPGLMELARDLIDESIRRLDLIYVIRAARGDVDEEAPQLEGYKVEEPRAVYRVEDRRSLPAIATEFTAADLSAEDLLAWAVTPVRPAA